MATFMVIGERINPTGKKKLQAELKEGSLNLVRTMALEQEENGAQILDINMGMNGIDEKEMMLRTVYEVTSTVDLSALHRFQPCGHHRGSAADLSGTCTDQLYFAGKRESLNICCRSQRSTVQCLSCFRCRMRDCQKIPTKNMRSSV